MKTLEIYQIRWSIEVFFKDCKQYLHLSDCRSNTFDAQIAHISLVMMRYLVLNYYKFLGYQLPYHALFAAISHELTVLDLVSRLVLLLKQFIETLACHVHIDAYELYVAIIRSPELRKELLFLSQAESKT